MDKNKTIYIWDLAGTLFADVWNKKRMGFENYDEWVANETGKKLEEISDREYEEMYEAPLKKGWPFGLDIMPGFKEILTWTKNNEAFTTGVIEQKDWRAEYLNPKVGFDIKRYFQKINTTFDYEEINKKTQDIWISYLNKKYDEGYRVAVYADDKAKNCQLFLEAVNKIKEKHKDFSHRAYHMLNNNSGLKDKGKYFEAGSLFDILENEKKIRGE